MPSVDLSLALRRVFPRRRHDLPPAHCCFATSRTVHDAAGPTDTIVVLGGGISGLASAYYLAKNLPSHKKVVLIERSQRMGGWIQSERRTLASGAAAQAQESALFERGPRSIRPAGYSGLVMLDLVRSVGMWDRMLLVPKTAASAQNRFIWFANQLNKLPSSLRGLPSLLSLPVLKGIPAELAKEFNTPSRFSRPKSESASEQQRKARRELLEDESIESFVTRRNRGGTKLARNLISAVIHGIYAGDIRRLSVRSVLGFLWEAERIHGGLMRRFLLRPKFNKRYREPTEELNALKQMESDRLKEAEEALGAEVVKEFKNISVYSFPEGLQELSDAVERHLEGMANVEIRKGADCSAVRTEEGDPVVVETSAGQIKCDRVISSIPASVLAEVVTPALPRQFIAGGDAANVGVVNVAIPSCLYRHEAARLLKVEGFGFLIPRSVEDNKAGILGIVFDSDSLPTQDLQGVAATGCATAPTKLTVMMGGAHWQERKAPEELPSIVEMEENAKQAIVRMLEVPREYLDAEETVVEATLQRDCISWYTVGHPVRMARLHQSMVGTLPGAAQGGLRDAAAVQWKGKLTLVGASYTGVSVNDCVTRARDTVLQVVEEEKQQGTSEKKTTGLELLALQCGLL